MDDFAYIIIIGIIYIINCLILFLINITLCFIHFRDSLLHQNFFKVIFTQLILESIITLVLPIIVVIILISRENKKWHLVFHIVLNYCINTDLIYNIIILIYLNFNREKKQIDIDNDNDSERLSNSSVLRGSIAFVNHSFKIIHIPSLCLGLLHTIVFILIRDNNDYNIQSFGKWYYFFYPIVPNFYRVFIFISFLFLFIMSIPYKFVSKEKLRATDNIHLNHYCINCLMWGLFGIIMPIIKTASKNIKNTDFLVLLFSSAIFLIYLNSLCLFRLNCFYIDDIFGNNGKKFMNKLKLFLKLMFFKVDVPKPNFIDFNSTFISHALAYESDFSNVNKRDLSNSISL